MSDLIRSAIIGTGFMGEVHARAVRAAGGVVTRVAGRTAEAAEQAVTRLCATAAARSAFEAIAADDVDLVHICTPNATHYDLVDAAINHGKHVVCEKPLGTHPKQTANLTEAARTAEVVAAVPFIYRFYPTAREARARCRTGEAGPIRLIHGSYLQDWLADPSDWNWRIDPVAGGASRAFADIGVHWCDLAEFITGHRITRVHARFVIAHRDRKNSGVTVPVSSEDCATVLFETDRGAVGTVAVSQISRGRKNRLWLSVDGDAQALVFDQQQPDTLWAGHPETIETFQRGTPTAHAAEVAPYDFVPAGHPQGYQDSFTAFMRDVHCAIRGQQPQGLPSFRDGHRAAVVTDAVIRSAREEKAIEISEDWQC